MHTFIKHGVELYIDYDPKVLTEVEDGYGWYGALAKSVDGRFVQCHVCGQLKQDLPKHTFSFHQLTAREYRKKFGLSSNTRLMSDNFRFILKKIQVVRRVEHPELFEKMTEGGVKAFKAGLSKKKPPQKVTAIPGYWSLESEVKRNTSSVQALQAIKAAAAQVGHTPSLRDFLFFCNGSQKYRHTILKYFGSWRGGLRAAGFDPDTVPRKVSSNKHKYTESELIFLLKNFFEKYKRPPTHIDCKMGLLPHYVVFRRVFGSLGEARRRANIALPPDFGLGGYYNPINRLIVADKDI